MINLVFELEAFRAGAGARSREGSSTAPTATPKCAWWTAAVGKAIVSSDNSAVRNSLNYDGRGFLHVVVHYFQPGYFPSILRHAYFLFCSL